MEGTAAVAVKSPPREELEDVVIRFAGDSGDGVQITGSQFTLTTALAGNDLATFPDFPAEIRAPAGTTFGVSAFQIHFGSRDIRTAGDSPDVLVALNPAALMVNLRDLRKGGLVVADAGAFTDRNLKKAGYDANPLEDDQLDGYRVIGIDISKQVLEAVKPFGLSQKEALRSKNMWSLGLVYWLYDRDRQPSIDWLNARFGARREIADSNIAALNAGHAFGETSELSGEGTIFSVAPAPIAPGLYRTITGTEALAWGLVAGSEAAGLNLLFSGYPITPASAILHVLSRLKQFGVVTFQAEDEIAAACAAIGASYAGSLGVTSSSGPGVALKGEAIGLAISVELPLIVVNSQRAGPSTGMPTKTEQSDLYQAVYGRNADSPLAVVAARSPADCFDVSIEAARIATEIHDSGDLVDRRLHRQRVGNRGVFPMSRSCPSFRFSTIPRTEGYHPSIRNAETLARAWAIPGTPGLSHRVGGIEKSYETGDISYDAENHQIMTDTRRNKILNIADDIPDQEVVLGGDSGKLAVVGWGSTYGPINRAVEQLRNEGHEVSHIHIRHIWPLPKNLGALLGNFEKVIVPEMNTGQLLTVLRAEYLVPAEGINQVNGQPFKVADIIAAIRPALEA